jgi:hypothetical protein
MEIAYDDLVDAFLSSMRRLCDCLSAPPCAAVRPLTQKQESQPPRETLINYDALLSA